MTSLWILRPLVCRGGLGTIDVVETNRFRNSRIVTEGVIRWKVRSGEMYTLIISLPFCKKRVKSHHPQRSEKELDWKDGGLSSFSLPRIVSRGL